MEAALFLAPWLALSVAVAALAFRAPAGADRRGRRGSPRRMRLIFVPLFLALAIGVPGLVIADSAIERGGPGASASASLTAEEQRGRALFMQTCASCHTLAAANARGITGPSLDQLGAIDAQRVETAIRVGGSGEKRMPAGLLAGDNARAVGAYVAKTAGS